MPGTIRTSRSSTSCSRTTSRSGRAASIAGASSGTTGGARPCPASGSWRIRPGPVGGLRPRRPPPGDRLRRQDRPDLGCENGLASPQPRGALPPGPLRRLQPGRLAHRLGQPGPYGPRVGRGRGAGDPQIRWPHQSALRLGAGLQSRRLARGLDRGRERPACPGPAAQAPIGRAEGLGCVRPVTTCGQPRPRACLRRPSIPWRSAPTANDSRSAAVSARPCWTAPQGRGSWSWKRGETSLSAPTDDAS